MTVEDIPQNVQERRKTNLFELPSSPFKRRRDVSRGGGKGGNLHSIEADSIMEDRHRGVFSNFLTTRVKVWLPEKSEGEELTRDEKNKFIVMVWPGKGGGPSTIWGKKKRRSLAFTKMGKKTV